MIEVRLGVLLGSLRLVRPDHYVFAVARRAADLPATGHSLQAQIIERFAPADA